MGITAQQALDCFASDDLIGIGMEADAVRRRLHPEGVVSYTIEREIDATGDVQAVVERVADAVDFGATGVNLQAERSLPAWESLLTELRARFPDLSLRGLSPSWIPTLDVEEGLPTIETLGRLHAAGLDALGIEEDVRIGETIAVHRVAYRVGMKTTASLTFGAGETIHERVDRIATVYRLQQETGGFTAFVPLVFHATGNGWDEATAVESLKTLAICRMMLDNIANVQAVGPLKVLQMGLRFGANDVGAVATGRGSNAATEEELRRIVRDAGFRPVQRDGLYRKMFLN